MSEEKPPMPAQPPTVQMPRVQVPSNQLDEILLEMRGLRAAVHEVADTQVKIVTRLDHVETDVAEARAREGDRSLRVRQESGVNLQQDAAIAMVITNQGRAEERLAKLEANQEKAATERAETAALTLENTELTREIKKAVSGWLKHPAVAAAVVGLIVAAATAGTAFFAHLGAR